MKQDLYELGDQVDDAVTELLVLWPQLGAALERDAGASEGEHVTTSSNVFALPINMDVLSAVRLLQTEVPPAALRARSILHEPGAVRDIPDTISSCAILYRRLVGRGYDGDARKLAATVLRWHRTVRVAIGLSQRARKLQGDGQEVWCPLHDSPLTQLRQRGDEGTLDETARGEREAITWQRGGGLYCPQKGCGGAWGPSEYAFLGRLVAEQRIRIAHQVSA